MLVLLANVRLDWKGIARYKHPSLLGLSSAMKETSFMTLTPGLMFVSKAGASFCRMSTRRMPSWGSTAEHTGDQLPKRVIINGETKNVFTLF